MLDRMSLPGSEDAACSGQAGHADLHLHVRRGLYSKLASQIVGMHSKLSSLHSKRRTLPKKRMRRKMPVAASPASDARAHAWSSRTHKTFASVLASHKAGIYCKPQIGKSAFTGAGRRFKSHSCAGRPDLKKSAVANYHSAASMLHSLDAVGSVVRAPPAYVHLNAISGFLWEGEVPGDCSCPFGIVLREAVVALQQHPDMLTLLLLC
jgi:hypothetical protein